MAAKKSTVRKKPVAAGSRKPRATEGKTDLPATTELVQAAGRALKKNSENIAQSLANRSIEGNIQSARFLLELAKASEQAAKDEGRRHRPSQALRLAEEPEWSPDPGTPEAEGAG